METVIDGFLMVTAEMFDLLTAVDTDGFSRSKMSIATSRPDAAILLMTSAKELEMFSATERESVCALATASAKPLEKSSESVLSFA